jgi:hypothetical protein
MLKVREIHDEGPDRTIFRIGDGGSDPSPDAVARLIAVATRLLAENGLPGAYWLVAPKDVALEIPPGGRNFLHDGILFAALDAVNDPVRNPTLTLLAGETPRD